jgi:hypothetical protein
VVFHFVQILDEASINTPAYFPESTIIKKFLCGDNDVWWQCYKAVFFHIEGGPK